MANNDLWRQTARDLADLVNGYAGQVKSAATTQVFIAQKQAERKKAIAKAGELVYQSYATGNDLPDELFAVLREIQLIDRDLADAKTE